MSDVSFQACGGAQYLEAYFGALANIVENPIGVYNRKCVLNRLKVAVPGEAVMIAWCNYGSYHDLFYKNSKYFAFSGWYFRTHYIEVHFGCH